jgi:two-component system copper resistance phosphate regulon response regulator CusR
MMEFRILLVEDEQKIAQSLKNSLSKEGYQVEIAFDGLMAEALFNRNSYSICLLDVNIPYKNGLELCKQFRVANPKVPIIMLTAFGELEDKLSAFNYGADDYIVKPFHLDELLARMKVFLKRTDINPLLNDTLRFADLEVNLYEKKVFRQKKEIDLSLKEYKLLEVLIKANGRLVSKQFISENVWDLNFDTGTNTIEVYINFLRNKIDKPFHSRLIHTKPGFGYYLKLEK